MTASQCHNALYSSMPDFEDMLQFESAYGAGCDVIVTRNKKHFPQDAVQIVDSMEFFENYWAEVQPVLFAKANRWHSDKRSKRTLLQNIAYLCGRLVCHDDEMTLGSGSFSGISQ